MTKLTEFAEKLAYVPFVPSTDFLEPYIRVPDVRDIVSFYLYREIDPETRISEEEQKGVHCAFKLFSRLGLRTRGDQRALFFCIKYRLANKMDITDLVPAGSSSNDLGVGTLIHLFAEKSLEDKNYNLYIHPSGSRLKFAGIELITTNRVYSSHVHTLRSNMKEFHHLLKIGIFSTIYLAKREHFRHVSEIIENANFCGIGLGASAVCSAFWQRRPNPFETFIRAQSRLKSSARAKIMSGSDFFKGEFIYENMFVNAQSGASVEEIIDASLFWPVFKMSSSRNYYVQSVFVALVNDIDNHQIFDVRQLKEFVAIVRKENPKRPILVRSGFRKIVIEALSPEMYEYVTSFIEKPGFPRVSKNELSRMVTCNPRLFAWLVEKKRVFSDCIVDIVRIHARFLDLRKSIARKIGYTKKMVLSHTLGSEEKDKINADLDEIVSYDVINKISNFFDKQLYGQIGKIRRRINGDNNNKWKKKLKTNH